MKYILIFQLSTGELWTHLTCFIYYVKLLLTAFLFFLSRPVRVSPCASVSMCYRRESVVLGSGWEDPTAVSSWLWLQLTEYHLTAAEYKVRATAAQCPVYSLLSNSLSVLPFPAPLTLCDQINLSWSRLRENATLQQQVLRGYSMYSKCTFQHQWCLKHEQCGPMKVWEIATGDAAKWRNDM